jgi:molybdenum cofactor synthesis domain-containing protein
MPKEGIFARVINGGSMSAGDILEYHPRIIKSVVITFSDRASKGEYKDLSGEIIEKRLQSYFENKNQLLEIQKFLLPDEKSQGETLLKELLPGKTDVIFTTGGTGIGPRDIVPEIIKPLLDKEIPGIMDMIRYKYGQQNPAALLSRSVAGINGKTLIFTLPGSPKAVEEYMDEIFTVLEHSLLMLYGLGH